MNRRTFLDSAKSGALAFAVVTASLSLPALASSDPIPGVDVVVEKVPPGNVVGRLQSDRRGILHFASLAAGTYVVRDRFGNSARIKHGGGPAAWQLVGSMPNGKPVWTLIIRNISQE
jgi:hypothetical protein